MMVKLILLLTLSVSVISYQKIVPKNPILPYNTYYHWKKIDYTFPSAEARSDAIKDGSYIEENVMVTAIKIFKHRMFITTPRYLTGVPSTLNEIPYNCSLMEGTELSPKLSPFPSWSMQRLGDCSAFQTTLSMEVDQYGRLWIADSGRTAVLTETPVVKCPAKLAVMDLRQNDKILMTYTFPSDVVDSSKTLMKDVNVACTSRKDCHAYIVDIMDNKLIVFDYARQTSWKLFHPSMLPVPTLANFTINGFETSAPFGITSSALAPIKSNFTTFYYSPIANTEIYAVATSTLKDPPINRNLSDAEVTALGVRRGQSDGWGMDGRGTLHYGNLPETAVYRIKTTPNSLGRETKFAGNVQDFSWPDTFAFDNYGGLLLTTVNFQLFGTPQWNLNDTNYRILRFNTNASQFNRLRPMICRA